MRLATANESGETDLAINNYDIIGEKFKRSRLLGHLEKLRRSQMTNKTYRVRRSLDALDLQYIGCSRSRVEHLDNMSRRDDRSHINRWALKHDYHICQRWHRASK